MPSIFEFSHIFPSSLLPASSPSSSISEEFIFAPINFLIHLVYELPNSDTMIFDSFFIFILLCYLTIILLFFIYLTKIIRNILSYLYDNNCTQQKISLKVEYFYKNINSNYIKIKKGEIIDIEEKYHFKNKFPYYISFLLNNKNVYFPIKQNEFETYSKKNDVNIDVTFKQGIKTIIQNIEFDYWVTIF